MSNYKNQSYVIDRHGQRVNVQFDRITSRIQTLCNDEYYGTSLDVIDPIKITQNVVMKFSSGISTKELDQLAIDDCTEHISHNEQYDFLAARLAITGFIHKETSPCIKEATNALVTDGYDEFSDEYVQIVNKYYDQINHVIDHKRDFKFKYFGYKTILKYLKKSKKFIERPQHAYMRVAISLFCGTPDQKGHLNDDLTEQLEQAFEFYDGLSRHYYSCASPIVLNGGTKVQQLSSCFLLPTGDDLSTLMDTHKDCAMISKWAGGIGVWLSSIRAEGAKIGSNGTASGIKHYVKMMNELQLYVNQRGLRPGAFAMYLEPWHADIFTFLEVLPRTHNITFNASDLKYALWIPDNFMRALSSPNGSYYLFSPDECPGLYNTHGQEFEDNYNKYVEKGLAGQLRTFREVKALEIFKAFYETVTQVGTPYVGFKDTVNKLSNMKNVATICSSNLCVSGDTYVLTETGQHMIKDIVGQTMKIWNGVEWSEVQIQQTGTNQELVEVTLSNGISIKCTGYHKFYDNQGNEIRAIDLKVDTKLEKVKEWPIISDGEELKYAYTQGFFAADGCYDKSDDSEHRCRYVARYGDTCQKHIGRVIDQAYPIDGLCRVTVSKRPIIQLYHGKMDLIYHIEYNIKTEPSYNESVKRLTVYLYDDMSPKFTVPINCSLNSKLRWFEGYCDGDGVVVRNGSTYGIQCSSVHFDFLKEVRLMLQTLGCDPKISIMYSDIKSEKRTSVIHGVAYECNRVYRLLISAYDLQKLIDNGFSPKRLSFDGMKVPNRDARQFITVVSVNPIEGLHDTYCFNEPMRHRGIFNGIMTGQCIEIAIPSWTAHDAELFGQPEKESEYGCCNLGAICLPSFVRDGKVDYLGIIENTKKVVRALDNVIDLNYYPAEPAKRSNFRHRPIGIGVMGLADVFQELRVVFGSPEARAIDQAISACIYYGAMLESTNIAEVKGSYPSYTFKNGAPALHGILQPDMHVQSGYLKPNWEQLLHETTEGVLTSNDWATLRSRTSSGLLRNSYVTAYMPTASTANIVGCNEASEPYTSNIYKRSSNTGEFMITNKYLIRELESLGIWNDRTRKSIMLKRGSVQHLNIPEHVKKMFKTSWEIDQRAIIVHAQARGVFICQMQSMNLFHKELTMQNLLTYIMLGWKLGLKSGCYYNHTQAVDTTVQSALIDDNEVTEEEAAVLICRRDNPDCAACSV